MILLDELNNINLSPKKRAYELQSALLEHPYGSWVDVELKELSYPEAYKIATDRDVHYYGAKVGSFDSIPSCFMLVITNKLQPVQVKAIMFPPEAFSIGMRTKAAVNVNAFGGLTDGYTFATFDKELSKQVEIIMNRFCVVSYQQTSAHDTMFVGKKTHTNSLNIDTLTEADDESQRAMVLIDGSKAWVLKEFPPKTVKVASMTPGMKLLIVSDKMSFLVEFLGFAKRSTKEDYKVDFATLKDAYQSLGVKSIKGLNDHEEDPHIVVRDITGGIAWPMLHIYNGSWCWGSSSNRVTGFYEVKDHP